MIVLLNDNDITKNTPLGGNIDKEKLRQCVLDAQSTRLEELLGETLYEKIEADFEADTLEGDYLTLYEKYIKPFLIRQSACEYLKIGAFTIANNGISLPLPQNASAITDAQLSNLIKDMSIKADMYAQRMEKWLCKKNLPEYKWNSENIINPTKPSITSWHLNNPALDEDIWANRKMFGY